VVCDRAAESHEWLYRDNCDVKQRFIGYKFRCRDARHFLGQVPP
jgi:hypothetical protein